MYRWSILVGMSGCGVLSTLTGPTLDEVLPRCDGVYQPADGAVVDQAFDTDNDGYVDGANAECAETFAASVLDCDDDDPQRSPGAREVLCNAKDDDCNIDTPDGIDLDNDGYDGCVDCADDNPFRNPGVADTCWDFIDNNCDGAVDPGCGPNYNGTYILDVPVTYGCVMGMVAIDFVRVDVVWIPPDAAFVTFGSGQPGTVNGSIADDGTFELSVSRSLASGLCTENYTWVGSFTGTSAFDATLTAEYFGNFCSTCVDQEWTIHAERVLD